jgi:hypothetical protein
VCGLITPSVTLDRAAKVCCFFVVSATCKHQ